ncbi:unnamed protein product [Cuscuta campestris]|uniref:Uncharacterized protein n=1 Tax=Cuscuta campestris TaxID=132261 RepID=A0A484KW98_9ASTE|nr:unnamed protein product [Cuscuta campestris]
MNQTKILTSNTSSQESCALGRFGHFPDPTAYSYSSSMASGPPQQKTPTKNQHKTLMVPKSGPWFNPKQEQEHNGISTTKTNSQQQKHPQESTDQDETRTSECQLQCHVVNSDFTTSKILKSYGNSNVCGIHLHTLRESSDVDLQFVGFHLQRSAIRLGYRFTCRKRIQSSKNHKNRAKIKVEIGSQLCQI